MLLRIAKISVLAEHWAAPSGLQRAPRCREYKSKEAAGQLDKSPYEFSGIGPSSPLVWLSRGYAVLSGPSLPIVAEGDEEPNDTYVQQLVGTSASAELCAAGGRPAVLHLWA